MNFSLFESAGVRDIRLWVSYVSHFCFLSIQTESLILPNQYLMVWICIHFLYRYGFTYMHELWIYCAMSNLSWPECRLVVMTFKWLLLNSCLGEQRACAHFLSYIKVWCSLRLFTITPDQVYISERCQRPRRRHIQLGFPCRVIVRCCERYKQVRAEERMHEMLSWRDHRWYTAWSFRLTT